MIWCTRPVFLYYILVPHRREIMNIDKIKLFILFPRCVCVSVSPFPVYSKEWNNFIGAATSVVEMKEIYVCHKMFYQSRSPKEMRTNNHYACILWVYNYWSFFLWMTPAPPQSRCQIGRRECTHSTRRFLMGWD